MILTAVSQAATVVGVSDVHLDRPASVMDLYSRVKSQLIGVVAMSLLVNIAVFIGLFLVIVPGVLLFLMWSLAVPVKVLESEGIIDAEARRSYRSSRSVRVRRCGVSIHIPLFTYRKRRMKSVWRSERYKPRP
jgi:hypothetical protein